MSEETNTEWAEMDIEAYRKNSNVEKKEQPEQKQAFEVEEPEEVPITHANVEAEVEEDVITLKRIHAGYSIDE